MERCLSCHRRWPQPPGILSAPWLRIDPTTHGVSTNQGAGVVHATRLPPYRSAFGACEFGNFRAGSYPSCLEYPHPPLLVPQGCFLVLGLQSFGFSPSTRFVWAPPRITKRSNQISGKFEVIAIVKVITVLGFIVVNVV